MCDGGAEALKAAVVAAGVSASDYDLFAAYVATFIDNTGNYKRCVRAFAGCESIAPDAAHVHAHSRTGTMQRQCAGACCATCLLTQCVSPSVCSFGDTKFIPAVPVDTFERIIKASPSYTRDATLAAHMDSLWAACKAPMYDLRPRVRQLGMGPADGITTYYSANMTTADVALLQRFTDAKALQQPYNSRVFKFTSPAADGADAARTVFQFRLASSATSVSGDDVPADVLLGTHTFEGVEIEVVRGDYAPLMASVVNHLRRARAFAANDTQVRMLGRYIESFTSGSMQAHIEGSRLWVQDKGPEVENYIGFIESYRDPMGIRGEWEGLVAVVNKTTSLKFGALVSGAEHFLTLLPWKRVFDKDEFMRPDFTSLEVLAFAGSGIPAGINIPNYDCVRQVDGFKNVSLGNVLAARNFKDRVTFLSEADQERFKKWINPAFEVQVGLHELLGHGSGKVFMEDEHGRRNFDADVLAECGPGATWYAAGQSWDTVFGSYASAMEECRAEAVGIYLCVHREVLSIFGHADDAEAEDVVYINWLNMARAGLLGLQFYTPETSKWGQAHMQARFVLLRVMLEAGEDFVTLVGADKACATGEEGDAGVHIRLDASKIHSVGVPAVARFLSQLQVYKSTANAAEGIAFFNKYSNVPVTWLPLRDLVVAKRKPRQSYVQPVLTPATLAAHPGAKVVPGSAQSAIVLQSFPATVAGAMDAFAA
ncbi:hypothetical protein EON62_02215, partial [archaeon]